MDANPSPSSLGLDVFSQPGPLTDAGDRSGLFDGLPDSIPELCSAVQGLVLHRNWVPAYGLELPPERNADAQARTIPAILERILELDPRPLAEAREPLSRFMGTCRDFALLTTAILRHQGVPARARCGFGAYFKPGHFEDHWVCEHWSEAQRRWVRSDPQIDEVQRKVLSLELDWLDLADDEFVLAGEAWRRCRAGEVDPELFGIFEFHGLDFVRGNVWRDLAALNRVELLPWDDWGLPKRLGDQPGNDAELAQVDRIAAATNGRPLDFATLEKIYAEEPEVRVEGSVLNWQTGKIDAIPGLSAPDA